MMHGPLNVKFRNFCQGSKKKKSYATAHSHPQANIRGQNPLSNGLTSTRYCKYSCVLLMMGGDTTRNMYSSFPEINNLCNVASRWKYIKRNILTMHGAPKVKFRNFCQDRWGEKKGGGYARAQSRPQASICSQNPLNSTHAMTCDGCCTNIRNTTIADIVRFQASALLFWDVTQHRVTAGYRRGGTTYWSHLQESSSFSWTA